MHKSPQGNNYEFWFQSWYSPLKKILKKLPLYPFYANKGATFCDEAKVKHLVDREEVGILLRLKESVNVVKSH